MLFKWLNASAVVEVGTGLADSFVSQAASGARGAQRTETSRGMSAARLEQLFQRLDREAPSLRLNTFRKATLANSFKWRLLEKGVEREIADELTQALVLRLSAERPSPGYTAAATAGRSAARNVQALLAKGNEYISRGAHAEAAVCYRHLLSLDPRHAIARNNLGAAVLKLGNYKEAEEQFRLAIGSRAGYPEAHCNLGTVLRWRGRFAESEMPLRRALKLKPAYVEAQVSLGNTLLLLGRLPDAKGFLEKALKVAPRNTDALVLLGRIAGLEGHLDQAEATIKRALEFDPKSTSAWAALMRLRRMTPADHAWLEGAEAAAVKGLPLYYEANIRYAIGKYYDDVGDFSRAFRSFQRANELQKAAAEPYDREARRRFVDDLMRIYTRETLSAVHAGASDSARPVLVLGMPRSGTSLVEQIIAAHPGATGAGELEFWSDAVGAHEAALRRALPDEALTRKLAAAYLRTLASRSADSGRVVDKATVNADYLGIIHWILPNARMIYLRRDPIDSCLSCYFQSFAPSMNFAMDLSDLADYYREHQRLVAHWRSVLPVQTLLEVPYEELVADQQGWTRRILDFLGLEWDARCLDFHINDTVVLTASAFQVRQKLYQSSVERWRNYRKYIGPLLALGDDAA
jgi:tetratricopeptide (TPR) repeat protein